MFIVCLAALDSGALKQFNADHPGEALQALVVLLGFERSTVGAIPVLLRSSPR